MLTHIAHIAHITLGRLKVVYGSMCINTYLSEVTRFTALLS